MIEYTVVSRVVVGIRSRNPDDHRDWYDLREPDKYPTTSRHIPTFAAKIYHLRRIWELGMVVGIPTAEFPDPGPDGLFKIPIPTSRRDIANYPTAGRDLSGSVGTDIFPDTYRHIPTHPNLLLVSPWNERNESRDKPCRDSCRDIKVVGYLTGFIGFPQVVRIPVPTAVGRPGFRDVSGAKSRRPHLMRT